jgi:serine/threonine protein kinase
MQRGVRVESTAPTGLGRGEARSRRGLDRRRPGGARNERKRRRTSRPDQGHVDWWSSAHEGGGVKVGDTVHRDEFIGTVRRVIRGADDEIQLIVQYVDDGTYDADGGYTGNLEEAVPLAADAFTLPPEDTSSEDSSDDDDSGEGTSEDSSDDEEGSLPSGGAAAAGRAAGAIDFETEEGQERVRGLLRGYLVCKTLQNGQKPLTQAAIATRVLYRGHPINESYLSTFKTGHGHNAGFDRAEAARGVYGFLRGGHFLPDCQKQRPARGGNAVKDYSSAEVQGEVRRTAEQWLDSNDPDRSKARLIKGAKIPHHPALGRFLQSEGGKDELMRTAEALDKFFDKNSIEKHVNVGGGGRSAKRRKRAPPRSDSEDDSVTPQTLLQEAQRQRTSTPKDACDTYIQLIVKILKTKNSDDVATIQQSGLVDSGQRSHVLIAALEIRKIRNTIPPPAGRQQQTNSLGANWLRDQLKEWFDRTQDDWNKWVHHRLQQQTAAAVDNSDWQKVKSVAAENSALGEKFVSIRRSVEQLEVAAGSDSTPRLQDQLMDAAFIVELPDDAREWWQDNLPWNELEHKVASARRNLKEYEDKKQQLETLCKRLRSAAVSGCEDQIAPREWIELYSVLVVAQLEPEQPTVEAESIFELTALALCKQLLRRCRSQQSMQQLFKHWTEVALESATKKDRALDRNATRHFAATKRCCNELERRIENTIFKHARDLLECCASLTDDVMTKLRDDEIPGMSEFIKKRYGLNTAEEPVPLLEYAQSVSDACWALQLLKKKSRAAAKSILLTTNVRKHDAPESTPGVWKANYGTVGTEIAVKKFAAETEEEQLQHLQEIRMLQLAQGHPLVINLLHFSTQNDTKGLHGKQLGWFLSMPFVKLSLRQVLAARNLPQKGLKSMADWPTRLKVLCQIAEANRWLCEQGVNHRDIKPDNILLRRPAADELGSEVMVCIADFGYASLEGQPFTEGPNNPIFLAPELLSGTRAAHDFQAADVYSFGLSALCVLRFDAKSPWRVGQLDTLKEMRLGKWNATPRGNMTPLEKEEAEICDGEESIAQPLWRLLDRCWSNDVCARPRFGEVSVQMHDLWVNMVRVERHKKTPIASFMSSQQSTSTLQLQEFLKDCPWGHEQTIKRYCQHLGCDSRVTWGHVNGRDGAEWAKVTSSCIIDALRHAVDLTQSADKTWDPRFIPARTQRAAANPSFFDEPNRALKEAWLVKPDLSHRAAFWRSVLTAHARSQDDAFAPCWDKPSFGWVDGKTKTQSTDEIKHRTDTIKGLGRVFNSGCAAERGKFPVHFDGSSFIGGKVEADAAASPDPRTRAKVYTVFHATRDLATAKAIIKDGFASLDHRQKWFGAGYYFSTSLKYVCDQYGQADEEDGLLSIIMARVIIGAPFPVLEDPGSTQSLSGQSCMPLHDAHVVLVDRGDHRPYGVWEQPNSQANQERQRGDKRFDGSVPYSEIVMFNPHNILPTAILKVG